MARAWPDGRSDAAAGHASRSILGLTIRDLQPPEDVPKLLELLPDTPNFDRTGPWRHRLKDGTMIPVLITSHSVSFGDRDARVVMAEILAPDGHIDID